MKVRNKILIAYSISVLVFVIVFGVIQLIFDQNYRLTIKHYKEEMLNSINNVINLRTDEFHNILSETTHRNPLHRFIQTHDTDYIKENLNILQNYNLSALWIVDNNRKLLYAEYNNCASKRILLPEASFDSINQYHSMDIYMYTDSGLVEIMGAAINNPNKLEKFNDISGYLFIARLWDKEYISGIENMLNVKLEINNPKADLKNGDKTVIFITRRLHNLHNEPVAQITFIRKSKIAQAFVELNHLIFVYLILFVFILILVLIITFSKFITNPLYLISNTLKTGKTENLKKLKTSNDEFGEISNLINEFFEQKKALVSEIEETIKAREVARLADSNFRSLYENIVHGVVRTSPHGNIIACNQTFVNMLGYSSEDEMLKLNITNEIYYFSENRKKIIYKLLSSRKIRNVEWVLKTKDGKPVICLVNIDSICSPDNSLLYLQGTFTDITEYKKLESKVQKLELAIKQSLEGVALIDLNYNYEYINDAWARMHGCSVEEMMGKNFNNCFSSDTDSQKAFDTMFEIVKENGYYFGDITQLHKNGSSFKSLTSCSQVKEFTGNIIGYSIIVNDITERIKSEEEIRSLNIKLEKKIFDQNNELHLTNEKLQQTINELQIKENEIKKSQQLYLSTINSTHEWIHYINRDYKFVLINDALINFIKEGGFETDVIGKNIKEVFPFLDNKVIDEYDFVFETGKEIISDESSNINGRIFYTETIKTPVFEGKNVVGVITIIRDISERVDTEKKILTAVFDAEENEKKRFSEDLHDGLGALLSTMKIYVNSIQKKKNLDEIKDLLVQLKEMIFDAIVNTKSISYNMLPNVLVDFGLWKTLNSYLEKLNATQIIDISFNTNYVDRLNYNVELNVFRIMQELINNSFKHGEAKSINIIIKVIDNKLSIIYSDSGKGFNLERILENKVGGLGINNIFARVKLLNGTCKFDSREGEGMRVNIDVANVL